MRRRSVLAAVAVLALSVLPACSSSDSGSDGPVALTYGLWDKNQVPAAEKLISAFQAKHPGITVSVQLTPYTEYFTKLQASATGGQAPDVFWMNGPNFQLYAANKMLQPLTDLGVDMSVYPQSLVELYKFDGVQFGLPKDFDTVGLWYNKKIFDAAGVAYPAGTWSWADFKAAATRLTDPAKGVFGVAAALEGQQNYYNTIYQAGGEVISRDGRKSGYGSPQAIEGLRFWTDLVQAKVSPTVQQMADTAPLNMFESGKVAMFWGGSWNAKEFGNNADTKDSVDVAALPSGARKATMIHGVANVVSARTRHAAQAAEFEKFLGSQEAALILAGTGTVIPAYKDTQSDWVKAFPQYKLQSFLDQVPDAVPLPVSANTATWNTLETDLLTRAWAGTEPVDAVARKLAGEMDAALAKGTK
ncbi:MAG: sugar ABC transporter substrate-binding protein [Kibdelosporangium sp.]